MSNSGMSLSETRLKEVPSVEDLEKIERYMNERGSSKAVLQEYVYSEIVERLAYRDERLEKPEKTLFGAQFEYREGKGIIDTVGDEIVATVFQSKNEDLKVRDALLLGGASTGKTMHDKAVSKYSNALEKAGYLPGDKENIPEMAGEAMKEINYREISKKIEDTAREAYEDTVSEIEKELESN